MRGRNKKEELTSLLNSPIKREIGGEAPIGWVGGKKEMS